MERRGTEESYTLNHTPPHHYSRLSVDLAQSSFAETVDERVEDD